MQRATQRIGAIACVEESCLPAIRGSLVAYHHVHVVELELLEQPECSSHQSCLVSNACASSQINQHPSTASPAAREQKEVSGAFQHLTHSLYSRAGLSQASFATCSATKGT
jgi:hypothetical protein